MGKCWFSCKYEMYEKTTADGGYVNGLQCKKCGDTKPVTKVSAKGARIQHEMAQLRAKEQMTWDDRVRMTELESALQHEIRRL